MSDSLFPSRLRLTISSTGAEYEVPCRSWSNGLAEYRLDHPAGAVIGFELTGEQLAVLRQDSMLRVTARIGSRFGNRTTVTATITLFE